MGVLYQKRMMAEANGISEIFKNRVEKRIICIKVLSDASQKGKYRPFDRVNP